MNRAQLEELLLQAVATERGGSPCTRRRSSARSITTCGWQPVSASSTPRRRTSSTGELMRPAAEKSPKTIAEAITRASEEVEDEEHEHLYQRRSVRRGQRTLART